MRIRIRGANRTVGIDDGIIVPAEGAFDVTLHVPGGEVRPGLVNAHEHLHRNHYGRLGHPPYRNAYEWGLDIHERDAVRIACGRATPRSLALRRGAWKNLRAGVTTVVHHDAWEPQFDDDFLLRVPRIAQAHSLGLSAHLLPPRLDEPFAIHLAEGIDERSASEVGELAERGLLGEQLLAVHAVGADAEGMRRLRASGAAVVWCPTSNAFLFGRTAPRTLLAPGVDVLVGSDSLLTGAGDLLDELRAARATGLVSDVGLMNAVGATAARRLGLAEPTLALGARADVVVLMRPLLQATAADVVVVIADGLPRVLHPALAPALGPAAHEGQVVMDRGVARWLHGYGGGGPEPALVQRTRPANSRRSRP